MRSECGGSSRPWPRPPQSMRLCSYCVVIELMAQDRLASVFAEWVLYAARRDAATDRQNLTAAVTQLEGQLASGSKGSGMEIMTQIMKRKRAAKLMATLGSLRERFAVDRLEGKLRAAEATIRQLRG